jgi:hypothetical protein
MRMGRTLSLGLLLLPAGACAAVLGIDSLPRDGTDGGGSSDGPADTALSSDGPPNVDGSIEAGPGDASVPFACRARPWGGATTVTVPTFFSNGVLTFRRVSPTEAYAADNYMYRYPTDPDGNALTPGVSPTNLNLGGTGNWRTSPALYDADRAMLYQGLDTGDGGGAEIFRATRGDASAAWGTGTAIYLGPDYPKGGPWVLESRGKLYFWATQLSPSVLVTEIYTATLNGTDWISTMHVPQLGSTSEDSHPVVTSDDLEIFMSSSRMGNDDLFTSLRTTTDEPFPAPGRIDGLSTGLEEWPTFITADGCSLYFIRESSGVRTLFVTRR